MHGTVHLPGMGVIGPVLTNTANPGSKAVQMAYDGDKFVELQVTVSNKVYKTSVPYLNFSHVVFSDEVRSES